MHHHTLAELSKLLGGGKLGSEELTRLYLERIARLDTQLNCFITTTPELALERVTPRDGRLESEEFLRRWERGHGLPTLAREPGIRIRDWFRIFLTPTQSPGGSDGTARSDEWTVA